MIEMVEESPKRRDKLVIMAEIIDTAKKGTSKTKIMFKASLSFSQLNQYLTLLLQARLLEKSIFCGKEIYTSTRKGVFFMEKQYQIINLINEGENNKSQVYPFENNSLSKSKISFTKLNT